VSGSVLPEKELLRFCFKEVTLSFYSFLIHRYAAQLQFYVASCSC
jgi:hypothetical protein